MTLIIKALQKSQVLRRIHSYPLDALQEILRAPHQYFRSHSPALLQQGEQTFEKFIYIWNIEDYRID